MVFVAVFTAIAPDGPAARAAVACLLGVVLAAVVVTSNLDREVRWIAIVAIAAALVGTVVLAIVEGDRQWIANGIATVLIAATIVELVRGLASMLRRIGVTVQAIAGGVAIYILIGLFFASLIGVVADVDAQSYFADGREAVMSERVYYSFTTITTTGFGEPVAATRAGQSIAVLEMLVGQIYLVTVIALLVGRAKSPRRAPES